jgi:hypothetical protein
MYSRRFHRKIKAAILGKILIGGVDNFKVDFVL